MLEKLSQFLTLEQSCEPKSLDVALNIAGVEKIPLENLWLRSTKQLSTTFTDTEVNNCFSIYHTS